jgi:hypothetical protein
MEKDGIEVVKANNETYYEGTTSLSFAARYIS